MADQPQTEATGDFTTALAVIAMHLPYTDAKGIARCASATHALSRYGPRWPCGRRRSAQRAVDAYERAKAQASVEPVVTS